MTDNQDNATSVDPQPTTDKAAGHTVDWAEAAEALCQTVEKRIEATARKAAESLYEGLLYDTQDYLRENTTLNLRGELDRAYRERTEAKAALLTVAKALSAPFVDSSCTVEELAVKAAFQAERVGPVLAAASNLLRNADSTVHTDAAGNRHRFCSTDDLEAIRAAIQKATGATQ